MSRKTKHTIFGIRYISQFPCEVNVCNGYFTIDSKKYFSVVHFHNGLVPIEKETYQQHLHDVGLIKDIPARDNGQCSGATRNSSRMGDVMVNE